MKYDAVDELLRTCFPLSYKDDATDRLKAVPEKVRAIINGDNRTVIGPKDTAWNVWNGVAEYADWYQARQREGDGRLGSIWFGGARDLKQKAFTTTSKLVGLEVDEAVEVAASAN
jgi:hypothetical protein